MLLNSRAETVTRSVPLTPDIKRVYLHGSSELHLTQGTEEYVRVTTEVDQISRVVARVRDNSLYLGGVGEWDGDGWRSRDLESPVRFEVQLRHIESVRLRGSGAAELGDLNTGRFKIIQYGSGKISAGMIMAKAMTLELAGSGDFKSAGISAAELDIQIAGSGKVAVGGLNAERVEIDIAGSGDLTLTDLNAASLETEISGSADIEIAGRAVNQELEINGSGDYRAADLETDFSDIEIRGSGDVVINVRNKLTAEILRGANLVYYAGPDLDVDIHGQGQRRNAGPRGD
jgi:hypothetical protein